jgi:PAS domain-containing protein
MTAEKQIAEVFEGATKSFYNTLLNQIQEGVYCLDRDRRIVLWNKGSEATTGIERSELLGKQCPEDVVLLVDQEGNTIGPLALSVTTKIDARRACRDEKPCFPG